MVLIAGNDVNVRRGDVDQNFTVHVWRADNYQKHVLNHAISKEICFKVKNAHLKII